MFATMSHGPSPRYAVNRPVRRLLSFLLALCIASPGAALAGYSVRCESNGNRYQYCSANTGGKVRLVEQYSRSGCSQGRDWGYDWNGVWVSNGCRARFDVGGSDSNRNNDAGKALAVAGGLAILGAMIAQSQNEDRNQNSGWNGDNHYYSNVPPWAVGTFYGQDRRSGIWETISIDPNGGVVRYANGFPPLYGNFNNGAIIIQGQAAAIQPAAGGIAIRGAFYGRQ
jgi:hypothetical protein